MIGSISTSGTPGDGVFDCIDNDVRCPRANGGTNFLAIGQRIIHTLCSRGRCPEMAAGANGHSLVDQFDIIYVPPGRPMSKNSDSLARRAYLHTCFAYFPETQERYSLLTIGLCASPSETSL